MHRADDDTRALTRTFSRTPTVAPQSRSPANDREGTRDTAQSERADVVVNVVPSERRRNASRFHSPCLSLAYRCVGTLTMFGLMLFLLGSTIVWSTREALARSYPSFGNIQAIFTEGGSRKVVLSVETVKPTEGTRRSVRALDSSATDTTSATNSTTSETTTTTGDPACQLNTDSFFCQNAFKGWYYKDDRCRSTAQDEYAVCPHFIGKLTSERDCRSRCFLFLKNNCAGFRTILRPCSSSDLSRSWYYFNASLGHCVQWDYPEGACPNITAGHSYNSQADCERDCTAESAADKPECERPSALMACPWQLMKHAYFYSELLGPTGDCYRADESTLAGHRCVNPAALFSTEEECVRKCATEQS